MSNVIILDFGGGQFVLSAICLIHRLASCSHIARGSPSRSGRAALLANWTHYQSGGVLMIALGSVKRARYMAPWCHPLWPLRKWLYCNPFSIHSGWIHGDPLQFTWNPLAWNPPSTSSDCSSEFVREPLLQRNQLPNLIVQLLAVRRSAFCYRRALSSRCWRRAELVAIRANVLFAFLHLQAIRPSIHLEFTMWMQGSSLKSQTNHSTGPYKRPYLLIRRIIGRLTLSNSKDNGQWSAGA